jgi:hypothetical protein
MNRVMPDLVRPTRGVRHTIDSAIPTLERMGVPADRVVLESAGAGWLRGTIVRQHPALGEPLTPRTRVVLHVAGTGALESMPFPLRDADDREFRVDRLLALFDNPLLKVAYHLRDAGGYLTLRPGDVDGAVRWLEEIFHVPSDAWPRELWYPLARLLPTLHRIAGRREAVPLAFRLVFGLPVVDVFTVPGIAPLPDAQRTRLARRNSRLGVDTVAGSGLHGETAVRVVFGPVSLDLYREHLQPERRRQRDALYTLTLPCHLRDKVRELWAVGSRAESARIGTADFEAVLGVNCYLGRCGRRRIA